MLHAVKCDFLKSKQCFQALNENIGVLEDDEWSGKSGEDEEPGPAKLSLLVWVFAFVFLPYCLMGPNVYLRDSEVSMCPDLLRSLTDDKLKILNLKMPRSPM